MKTKKRNKTGKVKLSQQFIWAILNNQLQRFEVIDEKTFSDIDGETEYLITKEQISFPKHVCLLEDPNFSK